MTKSEYQDLVEFIGPRFDAIDRRLDGVEDRLTRVEVGVEENRHQIQIVAEGVTAVRREMAEGFASVWSEFGNVRREMAEGFASVWSEFGNVRREMAEGFQAHGKLTN